MPLIEVTLRIELEYPIETIGKNVLKSHIATELEGAGGCRDPHTDLLFDAVKTVKCGPIRTIKP